MPKNGVLFATTILTLPKDYTGDTKHFFEVAYEEMKKMYDLKDEDIVSAFVHMDETSPHMHFCFIPHCYEKNSISWDDVMPKKMYKDQHKILKKAMEERLGVECNILNGETLGIDINSMNKENRKLSMELTQTKKELAQLQGDVVSVQIQKQELEDDVKKLENDVQQLQTKCDLLSKENQELQKTHDTLKEKIKKLIESLTQYFGQRTNTGRVLNSPFVKNRDEVESRLEIIDRRHDRASRKSVESVEDIMAMENVVESNTRALEGLKRATKQDNFDFSDIDEELDM